MLTYHGKIEVPPETVAYAEPIKHENYKVNNPGKGEFKVRAMQSADRLIDQLASLIGIDKKKLDFVYFSCCSGAEPHTDKLNPAKFKDNTFVVPVILPQGKCVIVAEGASLPVRLGDVYEFDHTKTHALELEDKESGCVVVMVGVLTDDWLAAKYDGITWLREYRRQHGCDLSTALRAFHTMKEADYVEVSKSEEDPAVVARFEPAKAVIEQATPGRLPKIDFVN